MNLENVLILKKDIIIKYNKYEFKLTKKQIHIYSGIVAQMLIFNSVYFLDSNFLYFLFNNLYAFLILLPISYYNR